MPARLGEAVERAEAAWLRPMALVAAAGATSTGLHDDLEAIGPFCRERGIWFHVGAAHERRRCCRPCTADSCIEKGRGVPWRGS